jgi:hypothetical protein
MKRARLAGLCEGIWVVASATELRAQTWEAPRWRVPMAGVLSLAVQPGQVAALGADGTLVLLALADGKRLSSHPVDAEFTQVEAGPGESWVLLAEGRSAMLTSTGLLDVATPSSLPRDLEALAPSGDLRAWFEQGKLMLQKGLFDTPSCLSAWPDTDSSHAPLVPSGLAFFSETQLLLAFTNGRSHLLDLEQGPMMMDAFPGDPRMSWVFVYRDDIYSGGN